MRYTRLGNTGLLVSRLGLGTMSFGGGDHDFWKVLGGLGDTESGNMLDAALDAGVNLIDTANIYSDGESEEVLGRILGGRRDDVVLATKVYGRMGAGPNDMGLSRLHVMRQLEDSLRRLGTDRIDLYQIHSFDPLTPLEETLRTLDDAVRQGKVRYIGASNLAAWQLMKALGVSALHDLERFASLQAYYSLVGRDIEREILPAVRDQGLGLLVYSPLAGGFLSGKFRRGAERDRSTRWGKGSNPPVDEARGYDVVDRLDEIAGRHGATVAQVALAWVMQQPGVSSVLVGASRMDQLQGNLAAAGLTLTEDDLAALDEVSRLAPEYIERVQSGPGAQRDPNG
ncbi:aldo/keto reductase [Streptomyces sp. NBC_00510]